MVAVALFDPEMAMHLTCPRGAGAGVPYRAPALFFKQPPTIPIGLPPGVLKLLLGCLRRGHLRGAAAIGVSVLACTNPKALGLIPCSAQCRAPTLGTPNVGDFRVYRFTLAVTC